MRKHKGLVVALSLSLSLALVACGDETDDADATTTTEQSGDRDQDRDQDRDRDRIHQVLTDVAAACGDQDRDRLRELATDRVRQAIDDDEFALAEGVALEVVDETVTFDGVEAQVEVRLRASGGDEAPYEVRTTWRLRLGEGDQWLLDDVPFCVDSTETPSTIRDREQDRSTTSQP